MSQEKTEIEKLSDLECQLLIKELTPLDPKLELKVNYVMAKSKESIQTSLEYVINETVQLWAKVHLDWTARDYQIPILEQGKISKRLVLRLGRRLGKCVTEDTEIIDLNSGRVFTVGELLKEKERNKISPVSFKSDLKQEQDIKDYAIQYNGIENTLRLETTCGYRVTATEDHPFLTMLGWKELSEIKEGEYVATVNKLDIKPTVVMEEHEIKFLAYMLGDGSTVDRLFFSNGNKEIVEEMKHITNEYDCTLKQYKNMNRNDYVIISNDRKRNKAIQAINKYELRGRYSHNKRIPKEIFGLDNENIALFLNRLFSTDGCVSTVSNNTQRQTVAIRYSSTSEGLIKDIKLLLLRFGIKVHVNTYESRTPDNKKGRNVHVLNIKRLDNIIIFLEKIGMIRDLDKQKSLLEYCKKHWKKSYRKIPSDILVYVEEICTKRNINYKEFMLTMGYRLSNFRNHPKLIQIDLVQRIGEALNDEFILSMCNSNIHWDKVKHITHIGERKTYDLSIEGNKNFLCGPGIVSHNTEDMCILILWHAFRKPNMKTESKSAAYEVLILTPFETQIGLIFDRLNQLIDSSPILQSILSRRIEHRIEFKDDMCKSIIKGLTIGTKSGNEGANTRGQPASLLVFDEADYQGSKEISNAMNIASDDPGRVKMIAASTPSGKHEQFYEWCTNASLTLRPKQEDIDNFKFTGFIEEKHNGSGKPNGWVQIYAPSTVNKKMIEINPDTGQTYLEDLKDELSQLRFDQEVMAMFGEEELGVYRKVDIDSAIKKGVIRKHKYYCDYTDEEKVNFHSTRTRKIIIVAIDWDISQATPNLLGLCYDKDDKDENGDNSPIFKVIFREEISKSKYTLNGAVQKLIELNEIFDFDHVALDRGMGEAQLETIKMYGEAHKETGLHVKTEGYHFGQSINIRDPHTGKKVDVAFKPYMVDNSIRVFEREQIMLNPKDKVLIRQLTNYRIKSFSTYGNPIFTSVDEHSVDTLNLSLLVFSKKYDKIFKVIIKNTIKKLKIDNSLNEEWSDRTSSIEQKSNPTVNSVMLNKDNNKVIYITGKPEGGGFNYNKKKSFKRTCF